MRHDSCYWIPLHTKKGGGILCQYAIHRHVLYARVKKDTGRRTPDTLTIHKRKAERITRRNIVCLAQRSA
jgi:hypothetical protein